jgi:hypothetical protein
MGESARSHLKRGASPDERSRSRPFERLSDVRKRSSIVRGAAGVIFYVSLTGLGIEREIE